ncbi:hypothetical protein BPLS_P0491 [Bathymodiolus platifrons methanotrophic gill symbiont]|uniref:hypothetical protein n=1 Tax=Bathymodiolus platifrons methanotrophic gill symbiont TaxID=113268 RepID=UPI000B41E236|nr:hypothetical protein [Bathymodiolus platifrons methanotrophic gill symbiont]GFO74067.1 hypothetical protein BPLS_P0491 [Bathymodiolus platifrons methanotrophic gill symbiont]
MQTFISAQNLSDDERITEASEILATAIIRLKSSPEDNNFPLDLLPTGSVHDRYNNGENKS